MKVWIKSLETEWTNERKVRWKRKNKWMKNLADEKKNEFVAGAIAKIVEDRACTIVIVFVIVF